MRWTLTTGVASNLYERLGTRLAANLMHGILLLEAIQGAIKTPMRDVSLGAHQHQLTNTCQDCCSTAPSSSSRKASSFPFERMVCHHVSWAGPRSMHRRFEIEWNRIESNRKKSNIESNPPPQKKNSTPPRGGLDVLVIRLGRHHCSTYTSTSNPPRGGGKAGMQHHHMIGQPA